MTGLEEKKEFVKNQLKGIGFLIAVTFIGLGLVVVLIGIVTLLSAS